MAQIIRGTTPTIVYGFNDVTVADITAAYLTFERKGVVLLKLELTDATVGQTTIAWTLTQQQTLDITAGTTTVMCNWKLNDGTRGASPETDIIFIDNHIPEVI